MLSAVQALERLEQGNRRFVSGVRSLDPLLSQARLREFVSGQSPFAVVLGCSDSRVPVEILFDQGIGELFVIRVAGNIATPSQIGSVEYAVDQLGTQLVVVLGHTGCGAVQATLDLLQQTTDHLSPHLCTIVDSIRPAVDGLQDTAGASQREELVRLAVKANVRAAAYTLRHESEVLKQRLLTDELLVVGADYDLETGAVEFFDGLPVSG